MNQIVITGSVGKDATEGKYDVTFTVATNRKWKDRNGEEQEKTTWHNISYIGRAKDAILTIKKGDRVCVIGEQEQGSFKKQDGSYGNYSQINTFEVYVQPKVQQNMPNDLPSADDPDWLK